MILIWVELSHAMQWFASWGIFVWLGKVSYGFYLMQVSPAILRRTVLRDAVF